MNAKFFLLLATIAICGYSQVTFATSPSIVAITTSSESDQFVVGDRIVFTFDQDIRCGEDCKVLFISGMRALSVPVEDTMIEGHILTILPQLERSKTYNIAIPKGAIVGVNGVAFDGLSDGMITVADDSEPSLISTVPVEGGIADVVGSLVFTFSKPMQIGNWTAELTCGESTIPISSDIPEITENVVSILYTLSSYIECTLIIDEDSLMDFNENTYSETIQLSFTTKDTVKPELSLSLEPINDLASASRMSDIMISLNDQTVVTANPAIDGGILVHGSMSGNRLYTAEQMTVTNNLVILPNAGHYLHNELVTVDVPAGMFVDSFGNANEQVVFTFTVTSQTQVPEVTELVDQFVLETDTMNIRFNTQIVVGDGSVTLTCTACEDVITITSDNLMADGNLLVVSFANATVDNTYTVTVSANAVYNIFGNGNIYTSLDDVLSVHAANKPVLIVSECIPGEAATAVPVTTSVSLKFDQGVSMDELCELTVVAQNEGVNHTAVLVPVVPGSMALVHHFSVSDLLYFVNYELVVPANCFVNSHAIGNDEEYMSFRTIRETAPSVISFNYERANDVLLDAALVFTFDQDVILAPNAVITLKPENLPPITRTLSSVNGNVVTLFHNEVAHRLSSRTTYRAYIPSNTVCNSDGLCMPAIDFLPFTTVAGSAARVVLHHTTPASGALHVPSTSQVTLHFTDPVRLATGPSTPFVIYEDGVSVTGTGVVNGQNVVMTFPLQSGRTYTYVHNLDMFTTMKGAAVLYDIGTAFSFTVEDTEGPELYEVTNNGMVSVTLHFNENVVASTGYLYVLNSASEQVIGPITAPAGQATTTMTVMLYGQNLPDDRYTLLFTEGFVKDLSGNDMLENNFHTINYDQVVPFITEHSNPVHAFAPISLTFNEAVRANTCTVLLEKGSTVVMEVDARSLANVNSNRMFDLYPTNSWESAETYTLTLPAGCFSDMRKIPMAETVLTVTTPTIPDLTLSSSSQPAVGSVQLVSTLLQEGVRLSFNALVSYMPGKNLRLVNNEGCILSIGEMSLYANQVFIPILSDSCLTGTISLLADAGTFFSTENGAHSPEATATNSFYSFSVNPERPVLVTATAVYAGGLQIAVNSRIDVTFDRAIVASEEALASLSFVSFLDANDQEVALAARYHGEINGSVLRIIVDEIFAQPPSSQIRSVVFSVVSPDAGIRGVNGQSDAALGSVVLTRLFSIPPVHTTLAIVDPVTNEEVEGPVSLSPLIRITFDQADITPVEGACRALMLFNQASTSTVDVHDLVFVPTASNTSSVFEWSPAAEIVEAGATFHAMVDNTCFLLNDDQAGTGASGLYTFVAGADTVRPQALSLCTVQGVCGHNEITLADRSSLTLLFSEPVRALPSGHVNFLDEVDGTVVTASAYVVDQESRVVVDIREVALRANRRYQVRAENVVEDLAGNPMQPMATPFVVITTIGQPHAPTAAVATALTSTRVMLSFTAARDPNLESDVSAANYCHYSVISANGEESFEDVCIAFNAEPVTIVRMIDVNPDLDNFALIRVRNALVSTTAAITVSIGKIANPVPAIPMDFAILTIAPAAAVASDATTTPALTYTFRVQGGASYGQPILGYTFLFTQEAIFQSVSLPANPFGDSTYSVDVALENQAVEVYVKATSASGSSGYSAAVAIADPTRITQVPSPVDPQSVVTVQSYRDTVEIRWTAPASPEALSGYQVTLGEESLFVTEPVVSFTSVAPGEHTVTLQAMNAVGTSEPTQVSITLSDAISAVMQQPVHTGATYAEVTFTVSFLDASVECIINAGIILQATASVEANHEATLVFYNLVPGFTYSGLCWAYSTSGSDVSSSMPLTFTTSLEVSSVTLTVSDLELVNNHEASMTITADHPVMVSCMLADANVSPLPADIFTFGTQQVHRSNVPNHYTLEHLGTATHARVFCATNSAQSHMAVAYISEELLLPTTRARLQLVDTSVPAGATNVSVHLEIHLQYDRAVVVPAAGVFTIENMATGAKMEIGASQAVVEGSQVTIRVTEALLPSTRYTYYMTNFVEAADARVDAAYIIYGEYTFTTAELTAAPTVELVTGEALESMMLPNELIDIALSFSVPVATLLALPVELKHPMGNKDLTASMEWSEDHQVLFFASYGILESQEYTVEIPACLVVNEQGVCNEATSLTFTGAVDTRRPVVVESQPTDNQNKVPNDVPLKLFFSEPVELKDVNKIILETNMQRQALLADQILVNGREVTIQLRKGYSFGNAALDYINVQLEVQEDAFHDLAGNMNEQFQLSFIAVPQRCGSEFLSNNIGDECYCHTTSSQCVCSCGYVNLFNL